MKKTNMFVCGLVAASLFMHSCGKKEEEKAEVIRPVKAIQVASIGSMLDRTFPARTKEAAEATLSFRVGGPLIKLNAEEGQYLRKGDLIAEIDPRDFRVDLEGKEARYIQAKAEKERYDVLLSQKSVSRNEYDIKFAAFKEARSEYQDARNALSDTRLYAPYNATVNKKIAQNFEKVQPEQPIVSILDESVTEIVFVIPEGFVAYADNVTGFEVVFDAYPGKVFNATFKEIVPKTEGSAGGFPVFLYLDYDVKRDAKYPIGYGFTCQVKVLLDADESSRREEFLIPVHAVIEEPTDKQPSVMIFSESDSTVRKRFVTIEGMGPNGTIRVLDGLSPDEWVVVFGATQLQDGQKAKLLTYNPTMTDF